MIEAKSLRMRLADAAPELASQLESCSSGWVEPLLRRLDELRHTGYPKTFNDPIWGEITLFPWETLILDSPIVQRLRNVRQLGMAHYVYPGAGYDRLEHSRGVVEAAERMMTSLERNAEFRRRFGRDRDDQIPSIDIQDRNAIRLAALLHDIGHAAFSHATEMTVASRLDREFRAVERLLREEFEGVNSVAPAEVVAVLIVASESMRKVFEHTNFGAWQDNRKEFPIAIIARIIGSRSALQTGYLSGIVSGPIDADKLDYMARDSHHAGLPLGLDLHRLISKLEVVTITPETAPSREQRERASAAATKRFHEVGISLSGLGAFEQMLIARVILYDRLYYHHKIRSAERMVRRLITISEVERGKKFSISDFFTDLPDDSVVAALGGKLNVGALAGGGQRSARLAEHVLKRRIHYRAFAFAARFLDGMDSLPEQERSDTRMLIWRQVLRQLATQESCDELAQSICDKAKQLKEYLPDDFGGVGDPGLEDVIVDLPFNKTTASGGNILTRTEDNHVAPPFLFFDPERWSQAYEAQKQCGFVFTPRKLVPLVGLASRIVFFERFKAVMSAAADRASKTSGKMKRQWFAKAAESDLAPHELQHVFGLGKPQMAFVTKFELEETLAVELQTANPGLCDELCAGLSKANRIGFAASVHKEIVRFIANSCNLALSLWKNGDFKNNDLDERGIQQRILQFFRDRGEQIDEGTEVGGGETDLVLGNLLVIENKLIRTATADPFGVGDKFSWQGRRYAIAVSQNVIGEFVAYQPSREDTIIPPERCIQVNQVSVESDAPFVAIRCVLPWNYGNPSSAKAP